MVKRIRPRVSPATVIATIALFAALGGGYATAFSGSGTVQKGALKDIPESDTTIVRSLTGIGNIYAYCPAPGQPSIFFINRSGETLNLYGYSNDDGPSHQTVDAGVDVFLDSIVTGTNHISVHISPVDGTKRPQADVQISATDTNNCSTSYLTVLALNTQE
jgi:hypothetical protein